MVDTGLDLSHPEFKDRPNTTALNSQSVVSSEDVHGTAVSSIVGAPANGQGLVGVYPQAALQEWDFGDGSLSDILAGLDAASKRGRGVINFSGGFLGFSALLEQAVDRALHRGAIVVAAVGNDRQSGNRGFVPASLPHVLTVGGSDQTDHVAFFSNRSSALDLDLARMAERLGFQALYLSGGALSAAAGVPDVGLLTLTEFVEAARSLTLATTLPLLCDADTGFGILSIAAALAQKAPAKDPQEPNDDINLVRPHALTASGTRLATPARLQAHLDVTEDPEDVYRIWVPAHERIAAGTHSAANVNLALWGPKTRTVYEVGSAMRRDLLAYSERSRSRPDVVSGKNDTNRGAFYYVDAFLGKRVSAASYSLKVSVARR